MSAHSDDPLHAGQIERIDDPDGATEPRKAAADWIEDAILDEGRWPMTLTELEEESKAHDDEEVGWSRQHFRNVLDNYFKPAEQSDGQMQQRDATTDIPALPGHERDLLEAYRMGFKDGFEEGRQAE